MIVDASVAVKWFLNEAGSDDALAAAQQQLMSAPDLILVECANAFRAASTRDRIAEEDVRLAVKLMPGLMALYPSAPMVTRATAIALELKHPVYDCLYLALAEHLDLQMLTADLKFVQAAAQSPYAKRIVALGHDGPKAAN